jgi:hypothetical protein
LLCKKNDPRHRAGIKASNPLKGRVIVQIRSSQVTGLCGRAIP